MLFPRDVGEITVAWLSDRLRAGGVPGADGLCAFTAEPVSRQGMTSLAHVLTLDYHGSGGAGPRKLLTKFSLAERPVAEALATNRGYEREVAFYIRFGHRAGLPVPRCYWAAYDAGSNRNGLLLEFIEETRATTVFTGRIEEIEQVVADLAPFHARWWDRAEDLAGLPPGQAPFMVDMVLDRLPAALDAVRHRYRAEVGETLVALLEVWIPNAHRLAERERSKPQTLCHGDLHRGQILFPAAGGAPLHVIDWQLAAIDSGPVDLATLLVSGLRPEQRAARERDLVERYHADLCRHGVADYPLDAVWASYRLGIARLAAFYMTAFSLGDIAPVLAWWDGDEARKGFSFWDVNCAWVSRALDDHDVVEHLRRSLCEPV